MKKINLRDYYPYYTQDMIVEVPDEVALLLREYMLLEEAYRIRTYRYKAFYSPPVHCLCRLQKGGKMSQTMNSAPKNVPEQRTYKVEDIAVMLNIGRTSAYSLVKEGHLEKCTGW